METDARDGYVSFVAADPRHPATDAAVPPRPLLTAETPGTPAWGPMPRLAIGVVDDCPSAYAAARGNAALADQRYTKACVVTSAWLLDALESEQLEATWRESMRP